MNWFKNFKIRNKFLLIFGFFIFIVAMIAGLAVLSIRDVMTNYTQITEGPNRRILHASAATAELANIRKGNVSMSSFHDDPETASRHYVLVQNSYSDIQKILAEWQKNVRSDPLLSNNEKENQISNFDEINQMLVDYMRVTAETHAAIIAGSDKRTITELSARCAIIGDKLVNEIGNSRSFTQTFINNQTELANSKANSAIVTITVFTLLLLLFLLLRDLFISRQITSPINAINKAINEIEKGNLSYPIRLPYKDEMGMLSNHIGDMVKKISDLNTSIAILDNLVVFVFVTDLDYNIIFVNDLFTKLKGVDRNSCVGQKCYKVVSGEDEPCLFCPLPDMLQKSHSFPSCDWERPLSVLDRKEEAWFACRTAIMRWTDGRLVLFNAYTDETIRKQHADQLYDAARLAEDASRIKSSFLANMSHEIRTPMNSIIGFSELALDNADLSPQTRDFLENIKSSSEGLLGIINDILDISKIEAGKIVLESIPFDLHDVFKICQSITFPRAEAKKIELFCYSEPTVGRRLIGDPTRLRQCILNLLTNSVKFTNYGIVKLLSSIVGTTDNTVTIHFEVKDSGIGMTDEQIVKIFDPFTQADNSTTRKYGGTGLGLTITKNFIELMGGELIVESAVGIGSKFTFELTFPTCEVSAEAELSDELSESSIEKPYFGGAEILVCEDHEMNQMVITEHLTRVGVKTFIAGNGRIGVDMVAERMKTGAKQFDLIFMDIHMPVMDGLEAVKKLKEIGNTVPIVSLTANVMSTDTEMYKEHGMTEHLSKPFATRELWVCLLKFLKPTPRPADASAAPPPQIPAPAAAAGKPVTASAATPPQAAGAGKTSFLTPPPASYNDDDEDAKLRLRLIANFVKGNQTKALEIKEACVNGDVKLAHRLAHTLKGIAGMVEQPELQKAAYDMEQALKTGDMDTAKEHIGRLETEFDKSLAALKKILSEAEAAAPAPPAEPVAALDKYEALELIEKLRPMLESGDSDCLKLIDGLKAMPASQKLIDYVEDYDFELALETLDAIKRELGG